MRRRINKLVDKVLDRSASPSPAPTKRTSKVKDPSNALVDRHVDLGDGHASLKESYKNIQNVSLGEAIAKLTDLVDLVDTTLDSARLIKLDNELKLLSDTISSIPKVEDSSGSDDRVDKLASDIDIATKKACAHVPQDSSGRQIGALLSDMDILTSLGDDLHMAITFFSASMPSITRRQLRLEFVDGVPAVGLKGAIGGLVSVLEAINKLVDNDDDLVNLMNHIKRLVQIVTAPLGTTDNKQVDAALQKRIDNLTSDIKIITSEAEKLRTQNTANKFMGNADNAAAISRLVKPIDQAVDRVQLAGSTRLEKKMDEGMVRIENVIGRVEARTLDAAEEPALNVIQPRADNAKYDSHSQTSLSFCLQNTRVALLNEIFNWVNDPEGRPMFWLNGMAGTGKSTIARTVAKGLDDRGLLGASFFFSRDEEDRQCTVRLFPTIAYQLARSVPPLREHIVAVANPDVCVTSMMQKQMVS
ncbi:hypothetical protein FRC02_005701 [Tulasnella sp. 418]|nr:hypothetical protein FRC02_005701 [Tulasnella sp. 418]